MYKNKRGLSGIVTMLIIIALALVAIGVVWYVVQNVIEQGQRNVEKGVNDIFTTCTDVGTITTEGSICVGGEISLIGGEYCCVTN